MEEAFNISDNTIKSMIEMNENIKDITRQDINDKIAILEEVKCTQNQILNIITSNSMILNRTNESIKQLINYLQEKGFSTLNILFDSNPFILNLEIFEIENYINRRLRNNELIEDIIDDLDSNPYMFDEI